jgi:RNA polymerase sigma-70 factor, ECF subfamily
MNGLDVMSTGDRTPSPDLAELPDEDLMERIVEGSEAAFALLVKRYQAKITNLVNRFIYNRDRAVEIAQEVFLRVYLHRKRYRRSGRFSTWIYTIAVNLAKNELRRKARLKGVTSLDSLLETTGDSGSFLADKQPGPDRTAQQHRVEEVVMDAIEQLPAKYREVILLRDIQQFTYEEIEQVLNIPGGTVRSRINRARSALKRTLEPALGRRETTP